MDYLQYTKIIILPYNSIDVNSREEIKEFDISIDEKLKEKLCIEEISLLKKDEFLNLTPKRSILSMISNPILYVSQNSISDTLKNFKEGKIYLMLLPGEYNIENENIIAENIKIITLSSDTENYSTVNISSNIIFDCKYFDAKGMKFTINKNKDSYFDRKYSTYSALIFTKKLTYLSFSVCEFTNLSNEVKIFNILEGSEEVNINNCKFSNSSYEIQKSNIAILTDNIFTSTDSNIRYSNSMFHRNNFNGNFRMSFFNTYLTQINNNNFIDIEAYAYCISADHKSKLYLTNNKITTTKENFRLVNVDRHSKCYIDNNDIEIKPDQLLVTVNFESELFVSNNKFNKDDIEIAGYDCKIFIEDNNKLANYDTLAKFFLSERNIIKPSQKYISFC